MVVVFSALDAAIKLAVHHYEVYLFTGNAKASEARLVVDDHACLPLATTVGMNLTGRHVV